MCVNDRTAIAFATCYSSYATLRNGSITKEMPGLVVL
jgi:hypothetical protein